MSNKKLTFDEFCKGKEISPSLDKSKEAYDTYIFKYNQQYVSIADLLKKGKLPGSLHD